MTSVAFEVLGARAEPYAAEPTIMLRLRISEADGADVHAVALKCQIRIEPQRRRYDKAEEARLYELFGEASRWGETQKPFLWAHVAATITRFSGETEVDLPVRCSYDMEVAANRYLHALDQADVPLILLFSGTVFGRGNGPGFMASPVAWHEEAQFRLPVAVWRETMDMYFPNGGWLRLHRDTLDALSRFKGAQALPTWDHTIEQLLKEAGEEI
ncbi:MAG: DUF6084 family protein [Acidimicrobiia bacterium]